MQHHGDWLPTLISQPWAWYSRTWKALRAVLQAVLVCTHGLPILLKEMATREVETSVPVRRPRDKRGQHAARAGGGATDQSRAPRRGRFVGCVCHAASSRLVLVTQVADLERAAELGYTGSMPALLQRARRRAARDTA